VKVKWQDPDATAPRERDGLFDIVRWKLPKTVRRRAASSACDEPPHPEERGCSRAPAKLERACARLEGWGGDTPSCFETAAAPPPQHEGITILSMRNERAARCARDARGRDALRRRVKNQPSRVVDSAPLFPACYLQGKLQLERVSRRRAATGMERVEAHAGVIVPSPTRTRACPSSGT
jgi:hypothetical protein